MMYFGRYRSQPTFQKSPQQMLGIVTYVFGHQESIAPTSWILNAKPD